MISLPCQDVLPIDKLAGAFVDVTNSYKYYWFLAILEQLEKKPNESLMSIDDLALRMLSLVWYPLDFYKLSFGKQDGFKSIAKSVSKLIHINSSPKEPDLFNILKQDIKPVVLNSVYQDIKKLIRYVPYRFQRPFIAEETKGLRDVQVNAKIVSLASKKFTSPGGKIMYLYIENESKIKIHSLWLAYLQRHLYTLRGFIYFEIVRFLQKNNPNVPGLSEKLFSPRERSLRVATKVWEVYLKLNKSYTCPFSFMQVDHNEFSLDHFVPWSYVVHDLSWNLLPIPKRINSSKGNSLPSLSEYLSGFCSRQFHLFNFLLNTNLPFAQTLLEDYVNLFGQDLSSLRTIDEEAFSRRLAETIKPLVQVATNLGFRNEWNYKGSPNFQEIDIEF